MQQQRVARSSSISSTPIQRRFPSRRNRRLLQWAHTHRQSLLIFCCTLYILVVLMYLILPFVQKSMRVNGVLPLFSEGFLLAALLVAFATTGLLVYLRWKPPHEQVKNYTLLHTFAGHTGPVYDVAWSPDGSSLASSSDDGTVRLWNGQSGALLHTLSGHTGSVTQ